MVHASLTTPGGTSLHGPTTRAALLIRLAALCAALALLGGCAKLAPPPPPAGSLPLTASQTLSQSFVAYDPGLVALEVTLAPAEPGDGTIELRLRDEPGGAVLATASLPVAAVTRQAPYRFQLSAPVARAPADLLAELTVSGGGSVTAQTWTGDANTDGTLFRGAQPERGDLMLAPRYGGLAFAAGWLGRLGWWALLALAAAALFVLPAWALLDAAWGGFAAQPLATRATLALGAGVAVAPLPILWTDAVGLHPGPWHAWLPVALAAAWLGVRAWRRRGRPAPRTAVESEERWAQVALVAVTALLVGSRFFMLHQVEAPLWGDSYQHTMIAQLVLDRGGLFDSWQPYAPYTTLTVQFGFPAHVALMAWLTGGDSVAMTLVAGQVINVAAALSLYPLARRLAGGNPWAGVAAVLVAGMLSPLPGFYVNWGRYAQLAGQAALPAALWLTWALLEEEGQRWGLAALLGATVSGMLLSYYRTAFFYAPFVALLLLVVAAPRWLRAPRRAVADSIALAISGAVCVALFLPWALNVSGSSLATKVAEGTATSVPIAEAVRADYQQWRQVADFVPLGLLLLAGGAALAGLVRRRWMLAALAPWTLLVASVAAGQLIDMPGASLMQSFAVIIALYIPVGLACGWPIGALLTWAARRIGAAGLPLAAAALAVTALAATPGQATLVAPSYEIVTRPDREAMAWIAANTPPDARFLVNGFRIYGGTSAVGADGGWWIPLLARRANTMPPQYALLNEQPSPADYTERVVGLVAALEQSSPASPAGEAALCAEGITHVYIGQGQGQVGWGGQSLLSLDALRASPAFTLVYQRDLVSIFAFSRASCGTGA